MGRVAKAGGERNRPTMPTTSNAQQPHLGLSIPSFLPDVDLAALLRRASAGEVNLSAALAADSALLGSAIQAVGGAAAVQAAAAAAAGGGGGGGAGGTRASTTAAAAAARLPSALPSGIAALDAVDLEAMGDLLRAFDPGEDDAFGGAGGDQAPLPRQRGAAATTAATAANNNRAAPHNVDLASLPPRLTARLSDTAGLLAAMLGGGSDSGGSGGGGGGGRKKQKQQKAPVVVGPWTAALGSPVPSGRGRSGGVGVRGGGSSVGGVAVAPAAGAAADDLDGPFPMPSVFGSSADLDAAAAASSPGRRTNNNNVQQQQQIPPGIAAAAQVAAEAAFLPLDLPSLRFPSSPSAGGGGRRSGSVIGGGGGAAGGKSAKAAAAAARAAAIERQRAKRSKRARQEAEQGEQGAAGAGPSSSAAAKGKARATTTASRGASPAPSPSAANKRAKTTAASKENVGGGKQGNGKNNDDDEFYSKAPVAAEALALPPGVSPAVAARELRKAKNRASALASRLRREGRTAELEAKVKALEAEVKLLEKSAAGQGKKEAASLAARGGLGARRKSERIVEMRRHLTL